MKICAWHFLPHRLIGAFYQVVAGWRICWRYKVPFLRYFPASVPCMTTAYNFATTLEKEGLPSPRTILDVGSNISQMTRLLLLPCAKTVTIHSFEPNSELRPIGVCHHLALSDTDGEALFCIPGGESMWGTINRDVAKSDGQTTVSKARKARMDSLVAQGELDWGSLPRPILAKVDTEGGELAVLKGFGPYIKDVDYLIMEAGNWEERGRHYVFLEMCRFLEAQGFRNSKILFACFEGTSSPSYCDLLFWRDSILNK